MANRLAAAIELTNGVINIFQKGNDAPPKYVVQLIPTEGQSASLLITQAESMEVLVSLIKYFTAQGIGFIPPKELIQQLLPFIPQGVV
jgi:hypothetical protein